MPRFEGVSIFTGVASNIVEAVARRFATEGGGLSFGRGDKFPMGVIMNTGMTVRSAQQHGQAYMDRLLAHAQKGEMNSAYLATHRFMLEDGPRGYDMFKHKTNGCVRAVFSP